MALPRFFFGYWMIIETAPGKRKREMIDVTETEFQLTTSGNVFWKAKKNIGHFPLLNCKIYVVHKSSHPPYCKLKFATVNGHVADCDVELIKNADVFVFHDGWCCYTCKKINKYGEYPVETPFDFLPALENSYFSDLVIKANNQKEFEVHRCILKYAAPKLDWYVDPPPLSGYAEDVLRTILYYFYSGCLPTGLSETSLDDVISAAKELPDLDNLVSLCLFQKENIALKNKIINLVSDLGVCISNMRDIFTKSDIKFKVFSYEFDELYYAVKKSFQEGAVAIAKFYCICQTYARNMSKLSEEDDIELLDYILSKVPIFNSHLKEYSQNLIGTIKRIHDVPDYWDSLMTYLVPKVQEILETISSILMKVGESSSAVASAFQDHYDDFYVDNAKFLETDFDRSPMGTVMFFAKEFKGIIFHFEKEKRRFNRIDLQSKARLICLALEEFLTEVTSFKGSFMDFIEYLEREIMKGKIYFEMRTTALKLNDLLNRFIVRRRCFIELLLQLCDLVERDSFFECVASVGFLEPLHNIIVNESERKQVNDKFPFVESACKSPPAYLSHLSVIGNKLLESRDLHDMIFEVIHSNELENSINFTEMDSDDTDSDSYSDAYSDLEGKETSSPDRYEVKAHRAIVGSRCDWFRLALASGMREDITRKIEIHITPSLFSLFLEFLYTGSLTRLKITFENFLKLLLLSDRYDFKHLKEVCEYNLRDFIDEQYVFILFNLADRYNASKLKHFCEDFISDHPTVVSSVRFRDLPDNLKREAIICSKGYTTKNPIVVNILCNESIEELEESLKMLKKRLTSMGVQAVDYEKIVSSLRPKLERNVVELQERIGSDVPRKVLLRTILDADYDINRATLLYSVRRHISESDPKNY